MYIGRKNINKLVSSISALLVLCGMACIFANNVFNYHAHILLNGSVVYHAHPYNKAAEESNPSTKHHHTDNDLLLVHSLNHFIYVTANTITIDPDVYLVETVIDFNQYHKIDSHYSLQSLRAPPLFV